MGITQARKYIKELHKRQDNPFLWPDFLTGLPAKSAILKKLEEIFPKLGRYSVAFVRIANIHPYLIKYGPDRHAEIIQLAAAILKTNGGKCKNWFVGTLSTHDFIIMCETKNLAKYFHEAGKVFSVAMEDFYTKKDLKNKTTLSFIRNGGKVNIGLIRLVAVIADTRLEMEKNLLIQNMGKVCDLLEGKEADIITMSDDLVY